MTLSQSATKPYKSSIPPVGHSLLLFCCLRIRQVPQAIICAFSDDKNFSASSLILNLEELVCTYSTPSPIRKIDTISPFAKAKFANLKAFQLVSVLLVERIMVSFIFSVPYTQECLLKTCIISEIASSFLPLPIASKAQVFK